MRNLVLSLVVLAAGASAQSPSRAFIQHNLVSDIPDLADNTDPALVNPWGICTSATSPFWLSDNRVGLSTLYNSLGVPSALRVLVPAAAGSSAIGTPTGCVFNSTGGFALASGANASFIFATQDGTISGWNSGVNANQAVIKVNNSASGAVYDGLAIAAGPSGPLLYAANFHAGTIDVFDTDFGTVPMPGAFTDPNVPSGFAPFNIQNLGGKLYVTYAKQNSAKNADVAGVGNGYVAVFDTSGNLLQHLISGGALNSPWGVAITSANFGAFSNDLLVGNFGDGLIHAYNVAGAMMGTLQDVKGNPIQINGLWGIQMGNGGNGGDPNALYFAAGISNQGHGLFGSIQAAPALAASDVVNGASFQPSIAPNTWIAIAGSNLSSTTRAWQSADFVNGALPTQLDGVTVTINGKPAYVAYISPKQINVLSPSDTTQGSVPVVVANNGLTSGAVTVPLQAFSPAFFLYDSGKYIVATHANGSIVGPATLTPATPAKAGETIVLWGTGFGPTTPATPSGQVVVTPNPVTTVPTIMIGGTAAQVTSAVLVSPGVYQFNVVVPTSTASGDIPVVAQIGSQSTQSTAAISVQ
ncbi:MAG TPA: TIGR03118 family protein [Bryobacteraceae bacterium]|nr:TIGR03118 family protein [Bryobacteraceae bacterium]